MGKCATLKWVKWVREEVFKKYDRRVLGLKDALALKSTLESAGKYDSCSNDFDRLEADMLDLGIGFVEDGLAVVVGDVDAASRSHIKVVDASGDWGEIRVRLHPDLIEAFSAIGDAVKAVLEGVSRAKR